MFSNIGVPGLIIIVVIALIIFGPSKLPELGKAFGRTLREFKDATKGLVDDDDSKSSTKKLETAAVKAEPSTTAATSTKEETTVSKIETANKAEEAAAK